MSIFLNSFLDKFIRFSVSQDSLLVVCILHLSEKTVSRKNVETQKEDSDAVVSLNSYKCFELNFYTSDYKQNSQTIKNINSLLTKKALQICTMEELHF